jgi:type 1 fimbriae regulatory protein FimB/type 1 fimbriae regulatory protein FimE
MSEKPKPPRRVTNEKARAREWMTESEVDQLRKAAAKIGENGHRNQTMVLLGFRHGLRVTELINLKWESIDLEGRTVFVKRLKNSKSNIHTLEPDEVSALRKLKGRKSGLVFLSERGKALSRRTFAHIIHEAGVAAKLPFTVHPHMLRHTCGYLLTAAGYSTRMVQDWLGHRNIQHTVRYSELDPDRFRASGKGMWAGRPKLYG